MDPQRAGSSEGACNWTRITVNPNQMGGVPCIRGLRIPAATVVGMVAEGMAHDEILRAYPDLRPNSNIRGWLVTIAHRKAIDQIRKNTRAPCPCGDFPEIAS